MRLSLKLKNPLEMEATLTVTMKLEEWGKFAKQLPSAYPAWKIEQAIQTMILQAQAHFDQDLGDS